MAVIRPLVRCKPWQRDQMFTDGKINRDWFVDANNARNYTKAQNCFYGLKPGDLVGKYDFVLLDGPFGNGRSFAFLWIKKHLADDAIILIDDSDDYPFVDDCVRALGPCEVTDNGRYAIVRPFKP